MGDLKNTSIDVEKVKYLDVEGLGLLWEKISNKFTRQDDLIKYLTTAKDEGGLIDNIADDKFVQQKAINELSERINDIASGGGLNIDEDTIIYNNERKLSTNLILFDDTENHMLKLVTNKSDNSTEISSWDYSKLYSNAIKDGMLKNVSLVVIPGPGETEESSGQGPGTYLKFEFETSSGSASPIYVDVSDLIDVYQGDNYITVNNDKISLNIVELCNELQKENRLDITSIKTRLDNVEGFGDRISELETKIDNLDIDGLLEQIQDINSKMAEFDSKLANIPTEPISDEDINGLE